MGKGWNKTHLKNCSYYKNKLGLRSVKFNPTCMHCKKRMIEDKIGKAK